MSRTALHIEAGKNGNLQPSAHAALLPCNSATGMARPHAALHASQSVEPQLPNNCESRPAPSDAPQPHSRTTIRLRCYIMLATWLHNMLPPCSPSRGAAIYAAAFLAAVPAAAGAARQREGSADHVHKPCSLHRQHAARCSWCRAGNPLQQAPASIHMAACCKRGIFQQLCAGWLQCAAPCKQSCVE